MIDCYIVCPNTDCWSILPAKEIKAMSSPECAGTTVNGLRCRSKLYEIQKNKQRRPVNLMAYHKLSTALRQLLQDPDVRAHLQDWRGNEADDAVGNEDAPLHKERAKPWLGSDGLMSGFWHGSVWRRQEAYTERHHDPVTHEVREPKTGGPPGKRVRHSSLKFGLKIVINADW
jgi:hypothetical protein